MIWAIMEKLIELLNQYNIELHWVDRAYKDGFDLAYEQEYMRDFRVAYLISKKFEFIKWLVDNDKIDTEKEIKNSELNWLHERYFREDCLLMLLSISDNPIEFLCSVLK